MSDDKNTEELQAAATDDEGDGDGDHVEGADSLLQLLVSMANGGLQIPVTLTVKGLVISGMLVGRKHYLKNFVTQFSGNMDQETQDVMRDAFGVDNDEPEVQTLAKTLRHIHIENARIYAPGQNPLPQNGMWWRGKISEVDGFTLGSFDPPKS